MNKSVSKNTTGQRVRSFRIQNNYTQAQFAEMIDISINFLSEIENGKKGMSQDTICKICQQFQLSADYLLFGLETNSTEPPEHHTSLIEIANKLNTQDLDLVIDYLVSLKKLREKEF